MQIMSLYQHVGIARFYYPGETIFRQGDPAAEMYLVLEGAIEVQHPNRPAEIVGASSIHGAQALLDGYRCDATAIACEPVALVPITAARFALLIQQVPQFAFEVIRVLADHRQPHVP
jgi:CRP-like cAMP-binding protein